MNTNDLIEVLNKSFLTQKKQSVEGLTVQELCQIMGLHETNVRNRIRKGIAEGTVKFNGYKYTINISGRKCAVPCYTLVSPPNSKNKKNK